MAAGRGARLGAGQRRQATRGAGREIQALGPVALEALEAQLAVEPAPLHLREHAADLEIHVLEERTGRPQPAVDLLSRAL
jgi:hypothetical protein